MTTTDDQQSLMMALTNVRLDPDIGICASPAELDALWRLASRVLNAEPERAPLTPWTHVAVHVRVLIEQTRNGVVADDPRVFHWLQEHLADVSLTVPAGRPPLVSAHAEWPDDEVATLPTCRDCDEPVIDPHPGCQPL